MLATTARIETPMQGSVRNARPEDTEEISRLITTCSKAEIHDWLTRGHLLVFDRLDGSLGAVAHVDLDQGHATIDLLVVDSTQLGADIEPRMNGVVHALCEAHGCHHVDTLAGPRGERGPRGRR